MFIQQQFAPAVVLLLLLCSKIIITNFCLHLSVCICSQTVVLISEGAKGSSDRVNYQFPLHQLFNNEMTQNQPPFHVLLLTTQEHICAHSSHFIFVTKIAKCYFIQSEVSATSVPIQTPQNNEIWNQKLIRPKRINEKSKKNVTELELLNHLLDH